MAQNKDYAGQLLDSLVELDKTLHGAYYEMGRILHAFHRDKLWEPLGYQSFPHMVEDELSFSVGTAYDYANTYARFRELKYTKNEALQLIGSFGWTNMKYVMRGLTQKVGKVAIRNRIEARGMHQMNFMLDEQQYNEVINTFKALGAEYSDKGRLNNASELFMELVRRVKTNGRKAA